MLLGIEFFLLTRFARIIKLDYNISREKIFIGLKIIKFFNGEMGVLITSLFLWVELNEGMVYVLSARPHRSAVTDFAHLVPSSALAKPSLAKLA